MHNERITVPREKIEGFCRRWKIAELALVGSALREDFRSDSDVDILVSFGEDAVELWGINNFFSTSPFGVYPPLALIYNAV